MLLQARRVGFQWMPQNYFSQHTHSKGLKHTVIVLNVNICAMFIACRALYINTSRFSSEPDMHPEPSQAHRKYHVPDHCRVC